LTLLAYVPSDVCGRLPCHVFRAQLETLMEEKKDLAMEYVALR
jgi:hypothetical protein